MPNHYTNRTAELTTSQRFFHYVEFTDSCWLWRGALAHGYGRFRVEGRLVGAHRYAYEFCVGPIPDGLQIDHLCRVRHCVNPDHMEPVTQRVNILRGEGLAAQHARATHCPHGHPYDKGNTILSKGKRFCRICRDTRNRRAGAGPVGARRSGEDELGTIFGSPIDTG